MTRKISRTSHATITLNPLRFRAVLALRGLTLDRLARSCGVTCSHLGRVVIGERTPSAELLAKVLAQIGEPGWRFVTGQADMLFDVGPAGASAVVSQVSP